jgi:predicted ATP-grasp superfamily ATP-dependent carboligase
VAPFAKEEISKAADKMQKAIVLKQPTFTRSGREVNKAYVADFSSARWRYNHISACFQRKCEEVLPLTINCQLIDFKGKGMSYQGSQVPYKTPRVDEIWAGRERRLTPWACAGTQESTPC